MRKGEQKNPSKSSSKAAETVLGDKGLKFGGADAPGRRVFRYRDNRF